MVEKDSCRFPLIWPKYSTRLLEPQSKRLSRPETDAHFDRWEVETLGDELARRKNLDPSGAKAGNRQGSNVPRGFAVDNFGGKSGFSESNGPSPSGVNGDIKDEGSRVRSVSLVVLDAIASNCRSSCSFLAF
jgi:hypothetical protein